MPVGPDKVGAIPGLEKLEAMIDERLTLSPIVRDGKTLVFLRDLPGFTQQQVFAALPQLVKDYGPKGAGWSGVTMESVPDGTRDARGEDNFASALLFSE
jgi:hypothetical protein